MVIGAETKTRKVDDERIAVCATEEAGELSLRKAGPLCAKHERERRPQKAALPTRRRAGERKNSLADLFFPVQSRRQEL